jgi:hypothetical protein
MSTASPTPSVWHVWNSAWPPPATAYGRTTWQGRDIYLTTVNPDALRPATVVRDIPATTQIVCVLHRPAGDVGVWTMPDLASKEAGRAFCRDNEKKGKGNG